MSFVHRSSLILGATRSGKSREALRQARALPPGFRGVFLATAQALDGDMRDRIARHQAERPKSWATVEEPYDIVQACERLSGHSDVVLLDCLTLWTANLILRGDKESTIIEAADALGRFIALRRFTLIIVSNEVGAGVHPHTDVGMSFRDVLGEVNQRVAAFADQVTYMVAGIPWILKDANSPRDLRDQTFESP
jgi:adenosyl cobinamide kinase/adenosyl cobinamide phosphate guanylyltransferase